MDISNIILLATEAAVQAEAHAEGAGGVIGTLGLNLKLFIAQLINFSIVLLILWKWVFKPVGSALEKRRLRIEDSIKKAQEIETRMQEFDTQRAEQMRKVKIEAEDILKKAEKQAESNKQSILQETESRVQKILSDNATALVAEKEKMFSEIREEVANLTIMAAEKILREKLDEHKDKKMVAEILKNLKK